MDVRRTMVSSASALLLALAACAPVAGKDAAVSTAPAGEQRYPSGPNWIGDRDSYSAGVLSAGDLNGDGMDDLVVDMAHNPELSAGGYAGTRVLLSPFEGGSLEARAHARVGGQSEFESPPAAIGDSTGDGLDDLVEGPYLYSGIEAGEIPEADASLTGIIELYRPCALAGHAGYCAAEGFWSPDGTTALLEPRLRTTVVTLARGFSNVVPWETEDGLELWTVGFEDQLSKTTLLSVAAAPVDPATLPQTTWELSGGMMALDQLAGDLTGDGLPDILGTIEDSDSGTQDVFAGLTLGEGEAEPVAVLHVGAEPGNTSLAVGDFDGDGSQDLAIGSAPDYRVQRVFVFRGPLTGELTQADADREIILAAGELQDGGGFGSALAAGDFDGDGRDDLAIGEPGYASAEGPHAGRTWISWGAELD